MEKHFTLSQMAQRLAWPENRTRKFLDQHFANRITRFGDRRAVPASILPEIIAEAVKRGELRFAGHPSAETAEAITPVEFDETLTTRILLGVRGDGTCIIAALPAEATEYDQQKVRDARATNKPDEVIEVVTGECGGQILIVTPAFVKAAGVTT